MQKKELKRVEAKIWNKPEINIIQIKRDTLGGTGSIVESGNKNSKHQDPLVIP